MKIRMPKRLRMSLATLPLVAALACSESPMEPTTPPLPVASIEVTPLTRSVVRGATLQLAARPLAENGQTLDGRPVLWTSLDPEVLTISSAGILTGVAEGTATIRAASEGAVNDVTFTVTAAPLADIVPSVDALVLVEGADSTISAVVRNALGEVVADAPLVWVSLTPLVAMVNGGSITALQEGNARIRIVSGTTFAEFSVFVRPDFGGDLVFASADGPFGSSRLYRTTGTDYATVRSLVDLNGFSQPVVSPDGQRIAFVCPGSGPVICVANIDGSNVKSLTAEEATYEDQPSWSPDGSKIAFRRYSAIGGLGPWNPSDIWVMNADGSGQVNLTDDAASQSWPAWSHADKPGPVEIAFVQDSVVDGFQTSRLAVMAADGSDRRYVTAAGMQVVERPQWMPGGAALLFTKTGGASQNELRVVTVASGAERAFLAAALPPGGQRHPTVSPNGRYVVFASQHQEISGSWEPQIYTAKLDGTDVRRRSTGATGKGEFTWVPTP